MTPPQLQDSKDVFLIWILPTAERKATEVVESAWQHCKVKEPHINGSQCLWR